MTTQNPRNNSQPMGGQAAAGRTPNGGETSQRDGGAGSEASGGVQQATDKVAEGASQVAEKAQEGVEQLKERAGEMEQTGRETAASTMERTAETIRERVPVPGAESAAQGMEQAAGYLQTHSTDQMVGDLESYIRQHPMPALVTALAAGVVLGRVMR